MFRKAIKVKNNIKTKSSERKKFIEKAATTFHLSEETSNTYFSKKDLYKLKISSNSGEHYFIYSFDSVPLFIEIESQLVPTVYFLWDFPDVLPVYTTHSAVVRVLQNGADFMIPGIVLAGERRPDSYGRLPKGSVCAINTVENRAPFAIGFTHHSSYDMFMCAGRGKAVDVFHILGDEVWSLGKKTQPPQLPWPDPSALVEGSASCEAICDAMDAVDIADGDVKEKDGASVQDVEEVEEEGAASWSADELLVQCFLHTLRLSVKDKMLPMATNLFYANHLRTFCPPNLAIEIKKTSFKKVSLFMREMQSRGLILLDEAKEGVQVLKSVNRDHEDLRHLSVCLEAHHDLGAEETSKHEAPQRYPGAPIVEEVWFVLDRVLPFFTAVGFGKGDCLTAPEIRSVLTEYVKKNNLQDQAQKGFVTLDPLLTQILYNKNDQVQEKLRWKELIDKMCSRMTDGYRMTFPNEQPILRKKEKFPTIDIELIVRGNKKQVTRVANLEQFRIPFTEFSKAIQLGRACSCSLVEDARARSMLQAQGDQRDFVSQLLLQKYKLPRKFIVGLEEGKPKK